jgi:hypothetical protein
MMGVAADESVHGGELGWKELLRWRSNIGDLTAVKRQKQNKG